VRQLGCCAVEEVRSNLLRRFAALHRTSIATTLVTLDTVGSPIVNGSQTGLLSLRRLRRLELP
jgi:hypothetical protein